MFIKLAETASNYSKPYNIIKPSMKVKNGEINHAFYVCGIQVFSSKGDAIKKFQTRC